jgi:signal transduction histidine kinase
MKPLPKIDLSSFYPDLLYDPGRLQFAMNAAGVGIWELNPVTNEVAWDDRCRELFGLSKENRLPFQKAIQYIHPDDLSKVLTAVQDALSGKNSGRYDMRYRTVGAEDKKLRWVHFNGQAYFDSDNKPVRFGGIAQDITAYTLEVTEASQVLQGALDQAKLATWAIDPRTGRTEYSERMQNWLGVDAPGRELSEGIKALALDEQERVSAAIQWAMNPESEGVFDLEYEITNPNTGRKRIIHSQARTFFDEANKPVKLMGTALDVTQQRNVRLALEQEVQQRTEELDAANEELRATNEELQTINEELGRLNEHLEQSNENLHQFAHVASHDLKEPVRKIKIFLGMVTSDPGSVLSDKAKLLVQRVTSATDRMFSMINGVLAYSSVNATGYPVEPVNLQETLTQIVEDLELMIEQKNATIKYTHLPIVEGAGILLYQLFSNLIINSLKFSKADTPPVIELTAYSGNQSNGYFARITVTDNGVGFAPHQADLLFNLFSRLHSKDKYEGTGLGLSLCRKIVQRHGGTIQATGHPGEGALFTITLPLRQTHQVL